MVSTGYSCLFLSEEQCACLLPYDTKDSSFTLAPYCGLLHTIRVHKYMNEYRGYLYRVCPTLLRFHKYHARYTILDPSWAQSYYYHKDVFGCKMICASLALRVTFYLGYWYPPRYSERWSIDLLFNCLPKEETVFNSFFIFMFISDLGHLWINLKCYFFLASHLNLIKIWKSVLEVAVLLRFNCWSGIF